MGYYNMNYELAKRLKFFGFPFRRTWSNKSHYYNKKGESVSYSFINDDSFLNEVDMWIPTLGELIEACGDKFNELVRLENSNFECRKDYMDMDCLEYKTPEEAVANLWLALNPVCEYCDGTGYTITPAYQSGGEIVDERQEKCICQDPNN